MNWLRRIVTAFVCLALVAGADACGGASEEDHPGHGVVTSVDVGARRVTLDHEDIPGLMKGMTMTFEVAPGVPLDGVSEGMEVDFRVKYEGGVYTVTELRGSGS